MQAKNAKTVRMPEPSRAKTVRLAAVQIAADPGARAANLRAAVTAMEAAAQHDPSPDVFVLPAFVDLLGPLRPSDSIPEPLSGPSAAALSAVARELGVYIAFGMAEWDAGGPFATAVLLDADGDVVLSHRQIALSRAQRKTFKPGSVVRARPTLVGSVALLMRDDLLDANAWAQVRGAGAQFVLGCASWPATASPPRSAAIAAAANAANACVLVADTAFATDDLRNPGDSCAITCDGKIVQAAPPGATHVCVVSVACTAKPEGPAIR